MPSILSAEIFPPALNRNLSITLTNCGLKESILFENLMASQKKLKKMSSVQFLLCKKTSSHRFTKFNYYYYTFCDITHDCHNRGWRLGKKTCIVIFKAKFSSNTRIVVLPSTYFLTEWENQLSVHANILITIQSVYTNLFNTWIKFKLGCPLLSECTYNKLRWQMKVRP